MNKDFNIKLLYFRYKDSPYYAALVVSVVFVISLILFFQLVIPQIETWFSIRDEILATRARTDVINQNINFMSNTDKDEMDQQVKIATGALPFEKDFGGILHAITDASTKSGVSLDDYFFQVGNIASVSGQQSSLLKDLSSVKVTVSVRGNVESISTFLSEINKKNPLSEVISIDGDSFITTIVLQFYQKQFPKIVFEDDKPLSPLATKERELLEEFISWEPPVESDEIQQSSSESAIPLF